MSDLAFKPSRQDVESFLESIPDESQRRDCRTLLEMMKRITKLEPKMWGRIVGFGKYHYKYASGHEGDTCLVGFAPRQGNLSLYVLAGSASQEELLQKLGKHKAGKGCLWIKRLDDVNLPTLRALIRDSVKTAKERAKAYDAAAKAGASAKPAKAAPPKKAKPPAPSKRSRTPAR